MSYRDPLLGEVERLKAEVAFLRRSQPEPENLSVRRVHRSTCPGCDGKAALREWKEDHFECRCEAPFQDRIGCGCTWDEMSAADTRALDERAEKERRDIREKENALATARHRLSNFRFLAAGLFIFTMVLAFVSSSAFLVGFYGGAAVITQVVIWSIYRAGLK